MRWELLTDVTERFAPLSAWFTRLFAGLSIQHRFATVVRSPRRWLIRGLLGVVVVSLVSFSGVATLSYDAPTLSSGTVESVAEGTTVVTSQGWHTGGWTPTTPERPAQLVGVGPRGTVNWTENGSAGGPDWFYDVDPLANGNLLVVNPVPDATVVYEFDPRTGERVWTERFAAEDIHDVDLINDNELLVAGISYDQRIPSHDRVFVYDRTVGEITWEWRFAEHYPLNTGPGANARDWTHVNDVDRIGPGEFLVSPRNFDQVIVINRSTKAIDLRLGTDDDHATLYEQHNPDYIESANGTPTMLVADSENDRIVEYARVGGPPGEGEWERVWTLTGDLNWPRDADRLPNGNTLVTDSMNHRVIEVTPTGEIVWEMYVPWATYDAERIVHGDGSTGPTMADHGVSGRYTLHNSPRPGSLGLPPVPAVVEEFATVTPFSAEITWSAARVHHIAPWIKPPWMPTWGFLAATVCLLVVVLWAVGEGLYHRRRLRWRVGRFYQAVLYERINAISTSRRDRRG